MNKKYFMSFAVFCLLLIPFASAQDSEYPQITDQRCDAVNPCPEGLECFSFPDIGLRCAESNPCSYYECPEGNQCAVAESYPGQVMCNCVGPECPTSSGDEDTVSGDEDTVSYDMKTQTVIHVIKKDEQTASHQISLRTTSGNRGTLETTESSVEYSNELIVEDSKLFMKTSVGKKRINTMPEEAIAISETPTSINKIVLKEDSKKPIYSIDGSKTAKIFGIFSATMKVETEVNAETGEVISINRPWWSFLAKE
jgi:uncharacterized membrane protein YkoI